MVRVDTLLCFSLYARNNLAHFPSIVNTFFKLFRKFITIYGLFIHMRKNSRQSCLQTPCERERDFDMIRVTSCISLYFMS